MFSIDEIVVSVTTLPLVRESVHSRKSIQKENKTFLFEKHHQQHTTPNKNKEIYDTSNIDNTMETLAAQLSSFKVPRSGRQVR